MTERDEFAIPICNANGDGAEEPMRRRDTGMRVTQAREESLAPQVEEPNFVTVRSRRGRRAPAPHEADAPPEESSGTGFPTPFTEDQPSPRCVLRDYREGARHLGNGDWPGATAYWVWAAIPLAVHMLAAFPLHQVTQRPSRFWVCLLITGILAAIIVH